MVIINMKFYRYTLLQYAVKDIDGEYVRSEHPSPTLTLYEYDIISETPKGYWIGMSGLKIKWISKKSKNCFAYPTKREALLDLIKRTEKRVRILDYQLRFCKIGLGILKSKQNKES